MSKALSAKLLLLQGQIAYELAHRRHGQYSEHLKPYINNIIKQNIAEKEYGNPNPITSEQNLRVANKELATAHNVPAHEHEKFHRFVSETPDLIVRPSDFQGATHGDVVSSVSGGGFFDWVKKAFKKVWTGIKVAVKWIAPIVAVVAGIAGTIVTLGALAPVAIATAGAVIGATAATIASVSATVATVASIAGTVATVAGATATVTGLVGKAMDKIEDTVNNTDGSTMDKAVAGVVATAGQAMEIGKAISKDPNVQKTIDIAKGKSQPNAEDPTALAPAENTTEPTIPQSTSTIPPSADPNLRNTISASAPITPANISAEQASRTADAGVTAQRNLEQSRQPPVPARYNQHRAYAGLPDNFNPYSQPTGKINTLSKGGQLSVEEMQNQGVLPQRTREMHVGGNTAGEGEINPSTGKRNPIFTPEQRQQNMMYADQARQQQEEYHRINQVKPRIGQFNAPFGTGSGASYQHAIADESNRRFNPKYIRNAVTSGYRRPPVSPFLLPKTAEHQMSAYRKYYDGG